ncbi:MAG TPA: peroxiredoxin-like family protein [Candidatus Acidoferrales bacterium]|nr:peroxiredoxin-like family protein [Candidatus Acidoferrales bacterium]
MPNLGEHLAALRAKYGSMLKPEISAQMEQQIEELRAGGIVERVLKPGQKAPPFHLKDQLGNQVSSSALLAKGPLIISFFRGTWCPYCDAEMEALKEVYADIRKAGAELVAITPQSAQNAQSYRSEHPVPFHVLVDEDMAVSHAFGVAYTMPEYLANLYKTVFRNDLSLINASGTWQLPIPARFVIAPEGTVVDVKTDPDYRYRPDPIETLEVLERMPV